MKLTIIVLLTSIVVSSCSRKIDQRNQLSFEKNAAPKDSMTTGAVQKQNEGPPIISLPFGPRINPKDLSGYGVLFYDSLIGENLYDSAIYRVSYDLPSIKKINYVHIDTSANYVCMDGKTVDDHLKITKYRYRLPRIANYDVYYICNFSYQYADFSPDFIKYCQGFLFMSYGYLILYDAANQVANVLNIYYSSGKDGYYINRLFYIDKSYTIYLAESYYIGSFEPNDKEVKTEHVVGNKYVINISQGGDINVNKK